MLVADCTCRYRSAHATHTRHLLLLLVRAPCFVAGDLYVTYKLKMPTKIN
eukprot:COSAG03_NODE_23538_length_279_cov_0.577778_1_plen_49_part_10